MPGNANLPIGVPGNRSFLWQANSAGVLPAGLRAFEARQKSRRDAGLRKTFAAQKKKGFLTSLGMAVPLCGQANCPNGLRFESTACAEHLRNSFLPSGVK